MNDGQSDAINDTDLRCGAKTRKGTPCRAFKVTGKKRCRMHGAFAGAPKGNRNAWKHGQRSREFVEQRKEAARKLRELNRTIKLLCESLREE